MELVCVRAERRLLSSRSDFVEKSIIKYEAYQEKIFLKEFILIFRVSSETICHFPFLLTTHLLFYITEVDFQARPGAQHIELKRMFCFRVKRPLSFSNWPHNWINRELLMRTRKDNKLWTNDIFSIIWHFTPSGPLA